MLNVPINELPHTSKRTLNILKNLEINTLWDLINYLPFRYEDYSKKLDDSVALNLQEGENYTAEGEVIQTKNERKGIRLSIQKILLKTEGGTIVEGVWFNQPYILRNIKKGETISISGKLKFFRGSYTIQVEEFEKGKSLIHTGKLVAIYPERKGISSKVLREKIFYTLKKYGSTIEEIFPEEIISFNDLISEKEAYFQIHFPKNQKEAELARKRLAFDEIFLLQLSSFLIKKAWKDKKVKNILKLSLKIKEKLKKFEDSLPFELRETQKKAIEEILSDMSRDVPMNRFLQGEVGSGKTIVAAFAMYFAHLNNLQSVLMAPTEILAFQHFQTLSKLLSPHNVKLSLRTRTHKTTEKELEESDVIIGTHALLNKTLYFKRVGLVIIDEQHRFGVKQRATLKEKATIPHLLTLTATPIPRTISLVFYNQLDISRLDFPDRKNSVKTYLIPQNKREDAYEWIKKQIRTTGSQVFIICPLIEESEKESMKQVKAAKKEYEHLKNKIFKEFNVALLHGKMSSKEKKKIMEEFKEKKWDILVSTSVVEVGIDIKDANIMIIETAERYGLSQLHQLRGRIGRGGNKAYCFLFTEKLSEKSKKRLNYFVKINDGMKLAELDLKLRGPGETYGFRQHGFVNLKAASLTDFELIKKSQAALRYFLTHHQIKGELKKRLEAINLRLVSRD